MNDLFKAFNDPTRRAMLEMLKEGDMTTGEMAERFEMSKTSIVFHLELLKQANLVKIQKQGQNVWYSLNMTVIDEIFSWFVLFQTKKNN